MLFLRIGPFRIVFNFFFRKLVKEASPAPGITRDFGETDSYCIEGIKQVMTIADLRSLVIVEKQHVHFFEFR